MGDLVTRVRRFLGLLPAGSDKEREQHLVELKLQRQERRLRNLDERIDAQRGRM